MAGGAGEDEGGWWFVQSIELVLGELGLVVGIESVSLGHGCWICGR